MIKKHDRDRLETLFGGYFHQDWDLKGSTWQEVMNAYVREYPSRAELRAVAESLRELTRMRNDRELASFVERDLKCDYYPGDDVREWLGQVASYLEEELRR